MKRLLFLAMCLLSAFYLPAYQFDTTFNFVRHPNPSGRNIGDVMTIKPEKWENLCPIPEHPGFDLELTQSIKDSLLSEINQRSREYKRDTLLSTDIFYIFKPYFLWLQYIDPHYRVAPHYVLSSYDYKSRGDYRRKTRNTITYLPFNLLNVNDTLIVSTSLSPDFEKGDMILSINGLDMKDVLEYNYSDRLRFPSGLLTNYYLNSMTNHYDVEIEREHEKMTVSTPGEKSYNIVKVRIFQTIATEKCSRIIDGVGYISIPEFFPVNSRLNRLIRNYIISFKKKGVHDVILDLRENPGGNGDRFDELLSIFIDKDTIQFLKSERVKIVEENYKFYSRTKDDIGNIVELTGDELVSKVPLIKKYYIPEMKYYILMNAGTGSTAASFCNIMNYNGAAVLLGEPLMHNALKYGEIIRYKARYPNHAIPAIFEESGVSCAEFDEHSKEINGVLYPDYQLDSHASEYLDGGDPTLEKAIKYIKRNGEKGDKTTRKITLSAK